MHLFHKTDKLTHKQAKNFYKQLINHGIPEKTAQKVVKLYEGK